MVPDPILLQYASAREGQRLIARDDAAAPFYWLTLDVIVQERSLLGPIERYCLQAVAAGLAAPADIAAYLGLERPVLDRTLVDLWRAELCDLVPDLVVGRSVRLTELGRKAATEASLLKTEVQELPIAFDRLLWKPSPLTRQRLLKPREVRAASLRQLDYAIGRQPVAADVPLQAVRDALERAGVLQLDGGGRRDLLAIRAVKNAEQVYWPVDLLAYVSLGTPESSVTADDVEFAIGDLGHLSREHGLAYGRTPQRRLIALGLASPPEAAGELPLEIKEEAASVEEVMLLQAQLATAENALNTTAERLSEDETPSETGALRGTIGELERERDELQARLAAIRVRQLQTWELADILREARTSARRRLLIISPWINREVVDAQFVQSLGMLINRGVQIHIGYGYPDDPAYKEDPRALGDLRNLAERSQGKLFLRKLGTTHEKVLIFDDAIVTASFNWLSFKGDRNRAFRRESGTLVRIVDFVDEQYEAYRRVLTEAA